MPSAIEVSLSSLLPTVSPLPDELTNLATSLLAQSRTKAATLKPEEEIGRTYACCHIACQRLGHRLALEIAKPAPPVKPRVYAKLHTYLNSVLKTTTTPRSTASARDVSAKAVADTPTRESRILGIVPENDATEASSSASKLKQSLTLKSATPTSRKRKAYTRDIEEATPTNGESTILQYDNTSEDQAVDGQDAVNDKETSIPSVKRPYKTPLRRKEKHGTNGDDDPGPAGLLPGLGTMFQPAIDWLSDERREEYARWKKAILREAVAVEQRA